MKVRIHVSPNGDRIVMLDGVQLLNNIYGEDMVDTMRASHVLPSNLLLRVCFRLIRKVCGDRKRFPSIADWTRRWNCKWIVDLSPVDGPRQDDLPFTSRQKAIHWEISWLEHNQPWKYGKV